MKERRKGIGERVASIFDVIAMVTLVSSTLLAFLGVVLRYGFELSYQWMEELCRYAIVYGVFIYTGLLIARQDHLKLDLVYNRFPRKGRTIVSLLIGIIGAFFCLWLLASGITWVEGLYTSKVLTNTGIFYLYMPALAVPLGAIIALFYAVREVVVAVRQLVWQIRGNAPHSMRS